MILCRLFGKNRCIRVALNRALTLLPRIWKKYCYFLVPSCLTIFIINFCCMDGVGYSGYSGASPVSARASFRHFISSLVPSALHWQASNSCWLFVGPLCALFLTSTSCGGVYCHFIWARFGFVLLFICLFEIPPFPAFYTRLFSINTKEKSITSVLSWGLGGGYIGMAVGAIVSPSEKTWNWKRLRHTR